MTWQPGLPILTSSDHADWQAWRKARKLAQQRERRRKRPRIDYYPSKAARSVLDSLTGCFVGGDFSTVIDALVLAGSEEFPE